MKQKFNKIEIKLRGRGILYLSKAGITKHKIYSKVFKNFVRLLLSRYIYSNKTYHLKSNRKQCGKDCNRSMGDLYRICLNYYPKATYEEFFNTVMSLDNLVGMFCNDINKQVYRVRDSTTNYTGSYWRLYAPRRGVDEFGIELKKFFENKKYFSNR